MISEPCPEGRTDCPTDVLAAVSQARRKEVGEDEFVDIALTDLMIDHEQPAAAPGPVSALPDGGGSECERTHPVILGHFLIDPCRARAGADG